jgi:protein SCO1/2
MADRPVGVARPSRDSRDRAFDALSRLASGAALALCLALNLAGCGKSAPASTSFHHIDITGANYAQDLGGLQTTQGKPVALADYRGKAVLVFFGYTRCPDVCPTTLQEAAEVMRALGPLAERLQVLFVTLDPAHDTAPILDAYTKSFDPRFAALRADEVTTRQVAQRFKIYYERVAGKTSDSDTFDHTAASFVFDPQGRVRLYVRNGQGPQALAADLAVLLKG